jgi:hypothetical protein
MRKRLCEAVFVTGLFASVALLRDQTALLAVILTLVVASGIAIAWDEWGAKVAAYASVPLVAAGVAIAWQAGAFTHSTARAHLHPAAASVEPSTTVFSPASSVREVDVVRRVKDAQCFHSRRDPDNPFAFVCTRGTRKLIAGDPCFAIEHDFACYFLPWASKPRKDVVLIEDVRSVKEESRAEEHSPAGWRPWGLELAGGRLCIREEQAGFTYSQDTFYRCANASSARGEVVGNVMMAGPVDEAGTWTVRFSPLNSGSNETTPVVVTRGWQ